MCFFEDMRDAVHKYDELGGKLSVALNALAAEREGNGALLARVAELEAARTQVLQDNDTLLRRNLVLVDDVRCLTDELAYAIDALMGIRARGSSPANPYEAGQALAAIERRRAARTSKP